MTQNLQENKIIKKLNSLFLSDEKVSDSDFFYFYGTYTISTLIVSLIIF